MEIKLNDADDQMQAIYDRDENTHVIISIADDSWGVGTLEVIPIEEVIILKNEDTPQPFFEDTSLFISWAPQGSSEVHEVPIYDYRFITLKTKE